MPTKYLARTAQPPSAYRRQLHHRLKALPALSVAERDQLSTLHDTAASTLMMVADGAALDPEQLVARARADLAALCAHAAPAGGVVDLVDALAQATRIHRTPAHVRGLNTLAIAAPLAQAILGAAREALNNVDRHGYARAVVIYVHAHGVTITDDGIGFDSTAASSGTGIPNSIVARMTRAGGTASVTSTPGRGTVVRLHWTDTAAAPVHQPDRPDNKSRLTEPYEDIIAVLRSIAAGEEIDERIRRLATLHTRRLRVLFDQAALVNHPLLDALRDDIDAAEARGVDVNVLLGDRLPCFAAADLAALSAQLGALLARARRSARLSITAPAGSLVASIVCQTDPDEAASPQPAIVVDGIVTETVMVGDTMWVTARPDAAKASHHDR